MRVVIRAFDKHGYHKDIVIMNEVQLLQYDCRVGDGASGSIMSGLIGVGCTIIPEKFPEMVSFEIVIRNER